MFGFTMMFFSGGSALILTYDTLKGILENTLSGA